MRRISERHLQEVSDVSDYKFAVYDINNVEYWVLVPKRDPINLKGCHDIFIINSSNNLFRSYGVSYCRRVEIGSHKSVCFDIKKYGKYLGEFSVEKRIGFDKLMFIITSVKGYRGLNKNDSFVINDSVPYNKEMVLYGLIGSRMMNVSEIITIERIN